MAPRPDTGGTGNPRVVAVPPSVKPVAGTDTGEGPMRQHLNLKIGLFFVVLAVAFAVWVVPTVEEDWQQTAGGDVEFFTVGPRFFPYLTAAIMGLLGLVLTLHSVLEVRAGAPPPRWTLTGDHLKPVLVFIALGAAYSAALPYLGVLIATPICLVICFRYFDLRQWGWVLLLAAGTTAVIYLCFEKIMMVPLPMGFLEM